MVDGCCAEDVEALKELVSFGLMRGFDKGCKSCGAALGEAEKSKQMANYISDAHLGSVRRGTMLLTSPFSMVHV